LENRRCWVFFLLLAHSQLSKATRETAVAVVHLGVHLCAGNLDVASVDNHDVVTGIDVVAKHWLTLAGQQCGNFGSHAAKRCFAGVYYVPLAGYVARFGAIGFHYLVSFLAAGFAAAFLAGVLTAAAGFLT